MHPLPAGEERFDALITDSRVPVTNPVYHSCFAGDSLSFRDWKKALTTVAIAVYAAEGETGGA